MLNVLHAMKIMKYGFDLILYAQCLDPKQFEGFECKHSNCGDNVTVQKAYVQANKSDSNIGMDFRFYVLIQINAMFFFKKN